MAMTSTERSALRYARHREHVLAADRDRARRGRAERAAYVTAYKLERGCADCGYDAHAEALDLDHRDHATKAHDVAYLVSTRVAWPRLLAELEKCDVVCANCHRVRTYSGTTMHMAHVRRVRPDFRRADAEAEDLPAPE